MENGEKMITISVDEYFELRQKADMNGLLMEKIGFFEARLNELENKIFYIERKVKEK